jgi:hypothetical protein
MDLSGRIVGDAEPPPQFEPRDALLRLCPFMNPQYEFKRQRVLRSERFETGANLAHKFIGFGSGRELEPYWLSPSAAAAAVNPWR